MTALALRTMRGRLKAFASSAIDRGVLPDWFDRGRGIPHMEGNLFAEKLNDVVGTRLGLLTPSSAFPRQSPAR
jgi:hypothetical protein